MFQVGSACYASAAAANMATASAQSGAVVTSGGTARVITVAAVDHASITYSYHGLDGSTVTQTVQHIPQPCGLLTSADAIELGWEIAVVWISAFAVMFIARALGPFDRDSSYGDT